MPVGDYLNSSSKIYEYKGLARGKVKALKPDKYNPNPNVSNTVQVELEDGVILPSVDVIESFAGEKCGTVFVPQVGEEVIVGFPNCGISRPVILGSVYNTKTPPLKINPKKNAIMMIQFPNSFTIKVINEKKNQLIQIETQKGHKIILNDGKKETLEVKEKSGTTAFNVDFKKGVIELKAKNKIAMSAGKDSLTLQSNNGLTLKSAAGKFTANVNMATIKAKSNATLQGAKATVKGTANAVVQSSAMTMVKGGIVKIN